MLQFVIMCCSHSLPFDFIVNIHRLTIPPAASHLASHSFLPRLLLNLDYVSTKTHPRPRIVLGSQVPSSSTPSQGGHSAGHQPASHQQELDIGWVGNRKVPKLSTPTAFLGVDLFHDLLDEIITGMSFISIVFRAHFECRQQRVQPFGISGYTAPSYHGLAPTLYTPLILSASNGFTMIHSWFMIVQERFLNDNESEKQKLLDKSHRPNDMSFGRLYASLALFVLYDKECTVIDEN